MNWEQIAKRWRENFVAKLQERYGLRDEEARMKADAWLQWLGKQSHLIPQTPDATEARRQIGTSSPCLKAKKHLALKMF